MRELAINKEIEATRVKLIDAEGQQLGVFSKLDALRQAQDLSLDLVEVSSGDGNGHVSICKLMDYGKYKYQQDKKTKKNKHSVKMKEIRLNPEIGEHDLDVKIRQIRKFLTHKDKVKVTFMYSARRKKLAWLEDRRLLATIEGKLEDVGKKENEPIAEGHHVIVYFISK